MSKKHLAFLMYQRYIFTVKKQVYFVNSSVTNVDSLDWKDLDAQTIISKVCNHKALGNGSIILCHNGAKHTAEALDEMLTNLKNQGYEIVPISELILRENYHMDVTGRQIGD